MTDHDPDAGLTPYERTRRAAHRAVERICDLYPQAVEDANSRGWPPGRGYGQVGSGSSLIVDGERIPATTVELAALQPSPATVWLTDVQDAITDLAISVGGRIRTGDIDVIRHNTHLDVEGVCRSWPATAEQLVQDLISLANQACHYWPPPLKPGETARGLTIGKRSNLIETCAYCGNPVTGGYRDPIRRVGVSSDPVHKSPCWYAYQTGRTLHRIT